MKKGKGTTGRVYFDHNATTYMRKEVLDAMMPYFIEKFGNASSLHLFGNLAIRGVIRARSRDVDNPHIVTSAIEHSAVLKTCQSLKKDGFEVSFVGATADGVVDVEELKKAIKPNTVLISVMLSNNETGVIQPIEEISSIAKELYSEGTRNNLSCGRCPGCRQDTR